MDAKQANDLKDGYNNVTNISKELLPEVHNLIAHASMMGQDNVSFKWLLDSNCNTAKELINLLEQDGYQASFTRAFGDTCSICCISW